MRKKLSLNQILKFKHYATDETREIEVVQIEKDYAIGRDHEKERYCKIVEDVNLRLQLWKSSYFILDE